MRYTVLIYEAPAEHIFGAVVPELPGCVSQGETLDEALVNIREAIGGHLAAMLDNGEDIPERGGIAHYRHR
jgi:predicted RNase H-like HicB family nuclease